jgi:hypothetical protein
MDLWILDYLHIYGFISQIWIRKFMQKNLTRIWIKGYSCRIISGLKNIFFPIEIGFSEDIKKFP